MTTEELPVATTKLSGRQRKSVSDWLPPGSTSWAFRLGPYLAGLPSRSWCARCTVGRRVADTIRTTITKDAPGGRLIATIAANEPPDDRAEHARNPRVTRRESAPGMMSTHDRRQSPRRARVLPAARRTARPPGVARRGGDRDRAGGRRHHQPGRGRARAAGGRRRLAGRPAVRRPSRHVGHRRTVGPRRGGGVGATVRRQRRPPSRPRARRQTGGYTDSRARAAHRLSLIHISE